MSERADGFTDYCAQEAKEDFERWQDGRCQCCGGKFLVGAADAEFEHNEGQIRRVCFWCFEDSEYDPRDPQPSRFSWGRC